MLDTHHSLYKIPSLFRLQALLLIPILFLSFWFLRKYQRVSIPAPTSLIVNQSRTCETDARNGGAKCHFRIGKDLVLVMQAVGTGVATTFIDKAKSYDKSDYYAKFTATDPCIRVSTGRKIDMKIPKTMEGTSFLLDQSNSWISPFDGIAYSTYAECIVSVLKFIESLQSDGMLRNSEAPPAYL